MQNIRIEISANAQKAIKALQDVASNTKDVGQQAGAAAGQVARAGQAVAAAGDKAKQASQSLDRSTSSMKRLTSAAQALAATGIGQAIIGITRSIGSMGLSCVTAAAQMKQYEIAFSTMLDNAAEGKKMLEDLQKFAAATPFDVPGVVSAGQQLMAFGFTAKEIIPMLTALGDAAAGLGKGSAGVSQMAYALGQMKTAGTLKTQDMMQLTTAGINAWQILADASGKTITEIKELTEKGAIDSAAAVEIIVNGMTQKFGGMMEKTSDEVAGLMANIEETAGTTAAVVGEYMINAFDIKGKLKEVSDALGKFQEKMKKARDEGASFTDVIKECVPPEVIIAVGALGAVFSVVLVGALSASVAALLAFVGISASAVAACAAIGAAIAAVVVYWDELCNAFNAGMQAILTVVVMICDALAEAFLGVCKKGAELFAWMFETIGGYCPEWLSNFNSMLDGAIESVRSWAREAIAWFQKVFKIKEKAAGGGDEHGGGGDEHGGGGGSYGEPEKMSPGSFKLTKPLFIAPDAGKKTGASVSTPKIKTESYSDKVKPYNDRLDGLRNEYNLRKQFASESRRIADERLKNQQKIDQAELSGSELKQAQYKAEIAALDAKAARAKEDHDALISNLESQQKILQEQKAAGLLDGTDERIKLIGEQMVQEETLYKMRAEAFETERKAIETTGKAVNELKETYESLGNEALGGIADAFASCVVAGESFSDAMKKLCSQMLQEVLQLIAKWLILTALMGVGGGVGSWAKTTRGTLFGGKATGGYISGPGTGTSDSVPTMLSNGEYVLQASAVSRLGVPLLNRLNSGRLDGFATGGYVGRAGYSNEGSGQNLAMSTNNNFNMSIQAMDAESFMTMLQRGGGDVIRQYIFDNNRNFASEAGVW